MYSQCYAIRTALDEVLDYPTSALADEDDVKSRKVKLIMMLCMVNEQSYIQYTTLFTFSVFR
jgi:hypothetical protein